VQRSFDASSLLAQFVEQADPGSLGVPYSAAFPGTQSGAPHVVFGFALHGNEHGTLPAALRLLHELRAGTLTPCGPVTLFIGNPRAIQRDKRFLDEDLNRVFTFDEPANTWERERAAQLRPVLERADIFLDFHQTQTSTPMAFWTFPWDLTLSHWARVVAAAPVGLTRAPGGAFSPGKCCADEFVRGRGKIGFTVEVGTRGQDPAQAELTYRAATRLLAATRAMHEGGRTLLDLSSQQPAIDWYETKQVFLAPSGQERLRLGYHNWSEVQQGQILSLPGSPELRAAADGYLLFPKYPAPGEAAPPELARLGVRLGDPERHYGVASS
jgi:succinylglutamate desuccinylase